MVGNALEQVLAEVHAARWLPAWTGMQVAAVLSAFVWLWRRTSGASSRLRVCYLGGIAGAAAGAFAMGVASRVPAWARSGFEMRVLLRGGLMAYGALLGLSMTYAALARLRGFGAGEALDRLAPCLGATVFFARIGCFFAGCDYGAVTRVPWGVRFPRETAAFKDHVERGLVLASDHASLAVHPTQLYEAAVGAAMAGFALYVERKSDARAPGEPRMALGSVFAATAATYAVGRFLVEGLRGDRSRGALGPLSTSQWISVVVFAVLAAAALVTRLRRVDG